MNMENYKVLEVHKRKTKYDYNEGTFMKFINEEFNKIYSQNMKDQNINNLNNNEKQNNSIIKLLIIHIRLCLLAIQII